jgi:hypothetical protein
MKILNILLLSIISVSITSCTKIIDIDLNDVDKKIIIEANLIEGTNIFNTSVTKTTSYFESIAPTTINNAIVTLNDGVTTQTLTNLGNGNYAIPTYIATENTTYTLTVTDGADVYTAISTMPKKINLDTITYIYQPASAFSDSGYTLFYNFTDPANIANYYRGTLIVNGIKELGVDNLYIFDDGFTDGNFIQIPVFSEIYQAGDVITASLYSLNKTNYQFYTTLDQISGGGGGGGGGSAAPGNPENNWSNDALGNFNTVCISSFTSTVQ